MKHALSDATCTAGATTLPLTTKGLMRYASLTTLGSLCLPLSTSSTSVSAAAFVIAPKVILRRDLFPNTEHQLGEHRRCCRRGGGRNYCRRHRCCRKSLFTRRIGRGDHFVHAKVIFGCLPFFRVAGCATYSPELIFRYRYKLQPTPPVLSFVHKAVSRLDHGV